MKGIDLEVGKKYWLDKQYDISGIFIGTDKRGNILFEVDPMENTMYLENEEGFVPMPNNGDYYSLVNA